MVLKGGTEISGGLYWKKGDWEIVTVEGKNGTLPGTEDTEYIRIPGTLFAPVALIMGLAFYLFLPLLGFAMVLTFIAKKVWAWFTPAAYQPSRDEHRRDLLASPDASRTAHIQTDGGIL